MLRLVLYEKYNVLKGGDTMKTAEEIIAYLEAELAEAYEQYDAIKGKDVRAAQYQLTKISVILNLLEEIK